MSEVSKTKKAKKRHHSSSSNYLEAPSKRIKVETSDSADNSSMMLATDFDCNASVVKRQQKKKHKNRHAAGVDGDGTGEYNVELSWTNTVGQHNAADFTAEPQSHESGLNECSYHKRLKHGKQQDSSLQQQNLAHSSQTVDQLGPPELRYTCLMTSLCCVHMASCCHAGY